MKWRRIIVVLFRLFVCLLSAMLIPHGGGGGREGGKIPRQDCRNHFVKFAFVAVMEVVVASVAVALCRGRLTVAATNISGSSTSKNAQK